jgi:hypothetical protein
MKPVVSGVMRVECGRWKLRTTGMKPVVSGVMRVECGRWKLKDHRHEAGGLRRYVNSALR